MRKLTSLLTMLIVVTPIAFAQTHATKAAEATPSDVYAAVDLLNRSMDTVLQSRNVPPPPAPSNRESGLGPLHVYELHVACIAKLHEFETQARLSKIPIVVSRPTKYSPSDVLILTQLMTADVRRVASVLKIDNLPQTATPVTGKTPTDVFQQVLNLYVKLCALTGQTKITPDITYAQLIRAVADAKSILGHIDVSRRYRIDAPAVDGDKSPAEVFAQCLAVRRAINEVRQELDLGTTPVPSVAAGAALRPEDVFVQTQIIIAELNLAKMGTGTNNSTPLAVPTSDKTPSDVYAQAEALQYLLKQISPLRSLVAKQ